MESQMSIRYSHELASLIDLIKSNTPEGDRVIEVLKVGDEKEIRRMLTNFGNPEDPTWSDIKIASPWAEWQINQAINDLSTFKPIKVMGFSFWAW